MLCILLIIIPKVLFAQDLQILDLQVRNLQDGKAQVLIEFNGKAPEPANFKLDTPTQMIFDFVNTHKSHDLKYFNYATDSGVITHVNVIEDNSRLRLVLSVDSLVPHKFIFDNNRLIINLDNDLMPLKAAALKEVSHIDFARTELGAGQLKIKFTTDSPAVNFAEDNDFIYIELRGAKISDDFLRTFDVKDFNTVVDNVKVEKKGNNINLTIKSLQDFHKMSYQVDNELIIEVIDKNLLKNKKLEKANLKYTGDKINLNFQDVSVRTVLQMIADFTDLNIIVSDEVVGNVTVRLDNVPWDQALDFILQSKNLGKQESEGVVWVAPEDIISQRQQQEINRKYNKDALAPLTSEYIQVNYAKADELVNIIQDNNNTLLSERGQVTVDERTNILLIKDTRENIEMVKDLLKNLDIPVRQVLIESQIVLASKVVTESLGLKFGGAASPKIGKYRAGIGSNFQDARNFANDPSAKTTADDGDTRRLFFDFTQQDPDSPLGKIGLALARLPGGTLLDLELQASESESKSKTIAMPKLLTLDQKTATIEQGEEIPYQVGSNDAGFSTEFKKAVLKLQVTPQITPDNTIAMALSINQDAPNRDAQTTDGVSVDTTSLETNVLVKNGETIVLGGILTTRESDLRQRIPYVHKLPIVGKIFRNKVTSVNSSELLVFVTPKIVSNCSNQE